MSKAVTSDKLSATDNPLKFYCVFSNKFDMNALLPWFEMDLWREILQTHSNFIIFMVS